MDAVERGADDTAWVEQTLAGDRRAFEPLVERYQRRVFALMYRYVRHEADAADLTQRAFVAAFEKLGTLQRKETFSAWLFRIAVNLAKNHIRYHSSKAFEKLEHSNLSSSPRAETDLVRESQHRALRQAISRLPEKQRQSILLRIDGDLSFREIGETIGISELSARVNFHHGLRSLRVLLNETVGDKPFEIDKDR